MLLLGLTFGAWNYRKDKRHEDTGTVLMSCGSFIDEGGRGYDEF
jgi:hypothetical protein